MYINTIMVNKQKTAFIVLATAGVFAFVFGAWQMLYNIRAPFKLKPSSFKLHSNSNSISLAEMQGKDTDKDKLNDYDELYIYNTSPYIEDSDSDGNSDYDEIIAGTDPNCPTGKECESKSSPASAPSSGTAGISVNSASSSDAATLAALKNLSAQDVREMLKNAGMDEVALKKMDDKTLMDLYKKALEKSSM